ncbi:hypothetical protein CL653_01125 [bacterium]|nr:hypothetical protein [bacterium]
MKYNAYMSTVFYWIKKVVPKPVLNWIRPPYHFLLAWSASVFYKHPSKDITVIAVTGTKGKSTVTEILTAILEGSGEKVASLSTIKFKCGDKIEKNFYKMTLPGRFFLQRFLRAAVKEGCTYAVIEMTSEGARQFRHRFVELDGLIFTNLTPEHIESHGSFPNYKAAKLSIAKQLERSVKRPRFIIANIDDEHGCDFLETKVEEKCPYSLKDLKLHTLHKDGMTMVFEENNKEVTIRVPLIGLFNVYNSLAAITLALRLGITWDVIEKSLRSLPTIAGRVEMIPSDNGLGNKFTAVVDYAHTPDSLEKFYQAFRSGEKVCVLGNTGGGRDSWKRPEMAKIAEQYCDHIILTNEDPYDEDPRKIVEEMAEAIEDKSKFEIIMDRREAIATALTNAPDQGYVLISGKGTDPYIMGPHNTRKPWNDGDVVREEMSKLMK